MPAVTYDFTGGVPLLEAAKCGTDQLKTGVVETFIQESPIAEMIPWMTIQGNALKSFEEGSLPDLQFRDVNAQYERVWGSDTEHFWGVTILGAEVFVDNYLTRVVANSQDIKAKQYAKITKSLARKLDKTVVHGTGSAAAKDFKGFNSLIAEGFGQGLSASGVTTLTAASLTAAEGQLFLDKLDEANDLLRNQSSANFIALYRATRPGERVGRVPDRRRHRRVRPAGHLLERHPAADPRRRPHRCGHPGLDGGVLGHELGQPGHHRFGPELPVLRRHRRQRGDRPARRRRFVRGPGLRRVGAGPRHDGPDRAVPGPGGLQPVGPGAAPLVQVRRG